MYLTGPEDNVVRCSAMESRELAAELTTAFAESDPDRRAEAFVALARSIPGDSEHDEVAYFIDVVASYALEGPPHTAGTNAASTAIDELTACRFYWRRPCATRPPVPLLAWITGIPSSLGLLLVAVFAAKVGGSRTWIRIRRWRERRRSRPRKGAKSR